MGEVVSTQFRLTVAMLAILARLAAVPAVVALAALGLSAPARGQGGGPPTSAATAMPFPGTPDASPRSQILLPGVQPAQLTTLTVRGSRSGSHSGRIVALPDQR